MKQFVFSLSILFLLASVSCQREIEKEGYVDVEGGKVWYKIVGNGEGIYHSQRTLRSETSHSADAILMDTTMSEFGVPCCYKVQFA